MAQEPNDEAPRLPPGSDDPANIAEVAAKLAAGMLSNPARGHFTVKDALGLYDEVLAELQRFWTMKQSHGDRPDERAEQPSSWRRHAELRRQQFLERMSPDQSPIAPPPPIPGRRITPPPPPPGGPPPEGSSRALDSEPPNGASNEQQTGQHGTAPHQHHQ